ncbi:hypothetical protein HMPREF1624_07202 [Sporothrix schenckii ATCC 58251]|uniref:Uncharacterized protein n=1 Tax=Sporothrix schenckii (strain ATCC 58251 / de Perez 2211183) TaxID=1391915 RepID=U7PKW8_SPOS1|nr:hypothetical protein HMPREF1624_07202 [Sporothrix schenckii ATCC 58251]
MATIPRFLLPRRGPMWQQQRTFASRLSATASRPAARSTASSTSGCTGVFQGVRHASTRPPKVGGASTSTASPSPSPAGGSPGHILEKPAKFNPPSHGARLPRRNANAPAAQHYGGDLSAAERAAQRTRQYPGMMAPPGTWAHWFWTSRGFHLGITMSTLAALAVFTLVENFRRTSPFVDMLPTWREAVQHPILAARTTLEVVRLTEHHRVTVIAERRQMRVDDVAKRTMYRKAHGLDETVGFGSNGGWFGGDGKKNQGPVPPPRNEVDDASPIRGEAPVDEPAEAGPRKKFLGIF